MHLVKSRLSRSQTLPVPSKANPKPWAGWLLGVGAGCYVGALTAAAPSSTISSQRPATRRIIGPVPAAHPPARVSQRRVCVNISSASLLCLSATSSSSTTTTSPPSFAVAISTIARPRSPVAVAVAVAPSPVLQPAACTSTSPSARPLQPASTPAEHSSASLSARHRRSVPSSTQLYIPPARPHFRLRTPEKKYQAPALQHPSRCTVINLVRLQPIRVVTAPVPPQRPQPDPPSTVKLESSTSPPPLCHSPTTTDRGRESTAEPTPISTPIEQSAPLPFARSRLKNDALVAWPPSNQPDTKSLPRNRWLDPEPLDLLFEDPGDCSFPLFDEIPSHFGHFSARDMAQTASPIDIATPPRFGSNSPQNQTSNLTSALREAGANRDPSATPNQHHHHQTNGSEPQRPSLSGRHDSIGGLGSSFYGTGARPITMTDRPRRESNTMNSLVNGLSWGGVSVGSWIRDE